MTTTSRKSIPANFDPKSLNRMDNERILDLIDLGMQGQQNISNLIAHGVVVMIERGAYELVKARFSRGDEEPQFLLTREARESVVPRILAQGWTQVQVAHLFGVGQATVNRIAKRTRTDQLPKSRIDSSGRVQPTHKPRAIKAKAPRVSSNLERAKRVLQEVNVMLKAESDTTGIAYQTLTLLKMQAENAVNAYKVAVKR